VEFCVTLHWTDIAVLLMAALTGSIATYAVLQRSIWRRVSDEQAEIQQKLLALTGALHAMEARLPELRQAVVTAAPTPEMNAATTEVAVEPRIDADQEGLTPEILAAITAAAAALLGRHARIRSVRPLPPHQPVSPWSQQGRVFVQASHNLRSRR
jgi:hypothetical protein